MASLAARLGEVSGWRAARPSVRAAPRWTVTVLPLGGGKGPRARSHEMSVLAGTGHCAGSARAWSPGACPCAGAGGGLSRVPVRRSREPRAQPRGDRTSTTSSATPPSSLKAYAASSGAIRHEQLCRHFNARWTSYLAPTERRPSGRTPDFSSSEVVAFATSGAPSGRSQHAIVVPTDLTEWLIWADVREVDGRVLT